MPKAPWAWNCLFANLGHDSRVSKRQAEPNLKCLLVSAWQRVLLYQNAIHQYRGVLTVPLLNTYSFNQQPIVQNSKGVSSLHSNQGYCGIWHLSQGPEFLPWGLQEGFQWALRWLAKKISKYFKLLRERECMCVWVIVACLVWLNCHCITKTGLTATSCLSYILPFLHCF